jgi:RNA polymerase sigma factor (sigma-70 family)
LDRDTGIGGAAGNFPSTDLSLLADATTGELSNRALERVVALYWKPVYRFIRLKFRNSNEDAKDLTQSFFATALQRDFFRRFDPRRAPFRTYVRMSVERFAANHYTAERRQKRGGGAEFEPLQEDQVTVESPEEAFEREWQRQLLTLALDDLRTLCQESGKTLHLRIFEAYDLSRCERPSYSELALRHGIAETSVTNYLAWARRMLRTFVAERLRGVTSSEGELRKEMRRLWS